MTKILILYYSMYGHVLKMARAAAEGAGGGQDVSVDIRRVPELVPAEILAKSGALDQSDVPVAQVKELAQYDGILFGTPTRYGNMCGQMRNFLDQTGSLWQSGALIGKVGSVFTSTATQHGGQESTVLSFHTTLLHLGMVIVGLPYSCKQQTGLDEIKGGSPYGAATIAGTDGKRQPSEQELEMVRFQGRHVAELAARLRSEAAA